MTRPGATFFPPIRHRLGFSVRRGLDSLRKLDMREKRTLKTLLRRPFPHLPVLLFTKLPYLRRLTA